MAYSNRVVYNRGTLASPEFYFVGTVNFSPATQLVPYLIVGNNLTYQWTFFADNNPYGNGPPYFLTEDVPLNDNTRHWTAFVINNINQWRYMNGIVPLPYPTQQYYSQPQPYQQYYVPGAVPAQPYFQPGVIQQQYQYPPQNYPQQQQLQFLHQPQFLQPHQQQQPQSFAQLQARHQTPAEFEVSRQICPRPQQLQLQQQQTSQQQSLPHQMIQQRGAAPVTPFQTQTGTQTLLQVSQQQTYQPQTQQQEFPPLPHVQQQQRQVQVPQQPCPRPQLPQPQQQLQQVAVAAPQQPQVAAAAPQQSQVAAAPQQSQPQPPPQQQQPPQQSQPRPSRPTSLAIKKVDECPQKTLMPPPKSPVTSRPPSTSTSPNTPEKRLSGPSDLLASTPDAGARAGSKRSATSPIIQPKPMEREYKTPEKKVSQSPRRSSGEGSAGRSSGTSSANSSLSDVSIAFSDLSIGTQAILDKALKRECVVYDTGLTCDQKISQELEFVDSIENLPLLFEAVKYFRVMAVMLREMKDTTQTKEYFSEALVHQINQAERFDFLPAPEVWTRYIKIITRVLEHREDIHVLLRSLEGNKAPNDFKECDDADEIALMCLKNYILHDGEDFDLMVKKSKSTDFQQDIPFTHPDPAWFIKTGSSFLMKIYDKLPNPDLNIQEVLPENNTFKTYVRDFASILLGFEEFDEATSSRILRVYGSLPSTSKVNNELVKLICKCPSVIEKFYDFGKFMRFRIVCTQNEETIAASLNQHYGYNIDYFKQFAQRMLQILARNPTVMDLGAIPKVDLIGLGILVEKDLAVVEFIDNPSQMGYQELLVHIFQANSTSAAIDANKTALMTELNLAYTKAFIRRLNGLTVYRLAIEKTSDQLNYLLQKDLHTILADAHPQWEDSDKLLNNLKKFPVVRGKEFGKTDKEKKGIERALLEDDQKKDKQHILLLVQKNNLLQYRFRTLHNEAASLFAPNERDTLLNFDLLNRGDQINPTLDKAIKNFIARNKNTNITVVQCQTEDLAGGVLHTALEDYRNSSGTCPVKSIPLRLVLFYRIEDVPVETIFDLVWNAVMARHAHFAERLGQILDMDPERQLAYHFLDWGFLFGTRNLPAQILCIYLTVALARNRIDAARCMEDKRDSIYKEVIRFILHCSRDRMQEIRTYIRENHVPHHSRYGLFRRQQKKEVLALLGLTPDEVSRFGIFFRWGEKGYDEAYRRKTTYFNGMFPEGDKDDLWEHLRTKEDDYKNKELPSVINRFSTTVHIIEDEFFFPGQRFDKNIFRRFKEPETFMQHAPKGARFGQEEGSFHQNYFYFNAREPRPIQYTLAHMMSKDILQALLRVFKTEFVPQDVVRYVYTEGAIETASLIAETQAYLLCFINKHLRFKIQTRQEISIYTRPLWQKPKNSFITYLDPPTPQHLFDTTACLQQLAFLDNMGYIRVAGRIVPTIFNNTKYGVNTYEFTQQCEAFHKRYFSLVTDATIRAIPIHNKIKPFPDFDKYCKVSESSDRIRLLPIYKYGSFPCHLEADN